MTDGKDKKNASYKTEEAFSDAFDLIASELGDRRGPLSHESLMDTSVPLTPIPGSSKMDSRSQSVLSPASHTADHMGRMTMNSPYGAASPSSSAIPPSDAHKKMHPERVKYLDTLNDREMMKTSLAEEEEGYDRSPQRGERGDSPEDHPHCDIDQIQQRSARRTPVSEGTVKEEEDDDEKMDIKEEENEEPELCNRIFPIAVEQFEATQRGLPKGLEVKLSRRARWHCYMEPEQILNQLNAKIAKSYEENEDIPLYENESLPEYRPEVIYRLPALPPPHLYRFLQCGYDDIYPEATSSEQVLKAFYYEYSEQIGSVFNLNLPDHNIIYVDGFTNDEKREDRVWLGNVDNPNRDMKTIAVRKAIGHAFHFRFKERCVYAEGTSRQSVFIQSPFAAALAGDPLNTVYRIEAGNKLLIADDDAFNLLIQHALHRGFDALYNLHILATMHVSFGKGWGGKYAKRSVTETPVWLEITLNNLLGKMDHALRRMQRPEDEPRIH